MKFFTKLYTYSARLDCRDPYPNEAEPSYFAGKMLDGITAVVTCLGTVTLLMYLLTF